MLFLASLRDDQEGTWTDFQSSSYKYDGDTPGCFYSQVWEDLRCWRELVLARSLVIALSPDDDTPKEVWVQYHSINRGAPVVPRSRPPHRFVDLPATALAGTLDNATPCRGVYLLKANIAVMNQDLSYSAPVAVAFVRLDHNNLIKDKT
jgi:hypothetical protein